MTELEIKVIKKLAEIPKGKVVTYKSMGEACGIKNGARFIGNVMAKNPWPEKYPCYKVVKTNGEIGNYSAGEGTKTKVKLLQKDGIEIKNGKIVNLEKYLYKLKKRKIFDKTAYVLEDPVVLHQLKNLNL